MTISVKHKFASAKADSADASLIRPSNWNDEHNITLAASRLLGRSSATAGAMEEISLGAGLAFSGSTLTSPADATKVNKAGDTMTGDLNITGTGVGLLLGSTTAASPQDLSSHISLFGTTYGFSITSAALNYVAGSANAVHNFYSLTTLLGTFDPDGTGVTGEVALVMPRLRLTSANDVSATSTSHPLQIGLTSGANTRFDNNEFFSLNNGALASFGMNASSVSISGNFSVGGTSAFTGAVTLPAGSTIAGSPIAGVYTGSTVNNTNYPIGTTITVLGAEPARNASATVQYSATASDFLFSGGTAALTGTWRGRGRGANDSVAMQRTA